MRRMYKKKVGLKPHKLDDFSQTSAQDPGYPFQSSVEL